MTLDVGRESDDPTRHGGDVEDASGSTRRVRVKICGITRPRDLDAAVDAGADAVGIVCDVPIDTPREVGVSRAASLVDRTPPSVTAVLVTMATDPDRVMRLAARVDPDAIQLHGEIGAGDLTSLRSILDAALFVAVDAASEGTDGYYDDLADALVIDSVDESGAGGTGETHDWQATADRGAELSSPIVLAGGLTPANVSTAVRTAAPFAVDVSSGVEATGGVKDHEAMVAFVERATNATSETVHP